MISADSLKKTGQTYGFLWKKEKSGSPVEEWHFNKMQEVIGEPIARGQIGIDLGSGCGYDTYIMAKNNPAIKIISMDISDGIYKTKELTSNLDNVRTIKSSVSDLPFKNELFDFAYSYGVLHHTVSPKKGLSEIKRILKKNSPVFLYLYEDHSHNSIKYNSLKIITVIRIFTVKIPTKIVYILSCMLSPLVFIIFSLPAKILRNFRATAGFAGSIPFNFATGPFFLRADLCDRFSAPIEHRFNKDEIYNMFINCGFSDIKITRLNGVAGWVVWGYKND